MQTAPTILRFTIATKHSSAIARRSALSSSVTNRIRVRRTVRKNLATACLVAGRIFTWRVWNPTREPVADLLKHTRSPRSHQEKKQAILECSLPGRKLDLLKLIEKGWIGNERSVLVLRVSGSPLLGLAAGEFPPCALRQPHQPRRADEPVVALTRVHHVLPDQLAIDDLEKAARGRLGDRRLFDEQCIIRGILVGTTPVVRTNRHGGEILEVQSHLARGSRDRLHDLVLADLLSLHVAAMASLVQKFEHRRLADITLAAHHVAQVIPVK